MGGMAGAVGLTARATAGSRLSGQAAFALNLAGRIAAGSRARAAQTSALALSGQITSAAAAGLSTFMPLFGRIAVAAAMRAALSTAVIPPPRPPQQSGGGGPAFPLHGTYEEFFRDLENLDRLPAEIIWTLAIEANDFVSSPTARLVYSPKGLAIPAQSQVLPPDMGLRFTLQTTGIKRVQMVRKARIRDDAEDVMAALEAILPTIMARLRRRK
jgi:hypothetical protein